MAEIPQVLCDGGCRRHWTVAWVRPAQGGEEPVDWLLCEVHSARSANLLTDLGFDAIARLDAERVRSE